MCLLQHARGKIHGRYTSPRQAAGQSQRGMARTGGHVEDLLVAAKEKDGCEMLRTRRKKPERIAVVAG